MNLSDTPYGPACPSRATGWDRTPTAGASRVATDLLVQTCHRHYPGGTASGIESFPWNLRPRPSPSLCWVGSHIRCFEACSAFTHVMAYLLAEPLERSFPSKASAALLPPLPLRLLPAGTTVAGWDSHPLKIGAFARRTSGAAMPIPVVDWFWRQVLF
jgi:hypothetical protein